MRKTDYWMTRLIVCSYILMTYAITFMDPQTRTSELVTASGHFGWHAVAMISFLSFCGILDVFVNDLLPFEINLPYIYNRRHVLFMFMAIGSVAMSGVMATSEGWSFVMLKFLLDATFSCALAYLEMFPRHRNQRVCP